MNMNQKQLEEVLLALPASRLDYPFGEQVAVYKITIKDTVDKMFAIIDEGSKPLRISLKCDPQLALHLREQYEEVLPGYHLNKKHWNTIILSGQLSEDEVIDLIRHSYDIVFQGLPKHIRDSVTA